MKKDLATYSLLAIVGAIVAYFVCGMFLPTLADTSFKSLVSGQSYSLTDPDPEIFNFRSINPTIEGYVDCGEYGSNSTCDEEIETTPKEEDNPTDDFFR